MKEPFSSVAVDPLAPQFKIFQSRMGEHLLIVPHSRIFDFERGEAEIGPAATDAIYSALANTVIGEVPLDAVAAVTPQSISLNVSSTCNLSCSYCYAGQGSFSGAQPSHMSWNTARAAVERLFEMADPDAPITVGFLGGEPFVNRRLIHKVVGFASEEGQRRGLDVRFSVTTNGTLIKEEDIQLFRGHPFAVTVSIDGGEHIQDLQRPSKKVNNRSHRLLEDACRPLLANPGSVKLAARATVTRHSFDLLDRFKAVLSMGFPEVGFSPLRAAGNRLDQLATLPLLEIDEGGLRNKDWEKYLNAMIEVADTELRRAFVGESIRLTNLAVALRQLYRGASSPYPCAAGGGYFSISANGDWYACHRAIGTAGFRMGDNSGLDPRRREEFLVARHVHSQSACRQCWARYLCSGGCHQESTSRDDSSCGFVRGWLEFCLGAYCEILEKRPKWFQSSQIVKEM